MLKGSSISIIDRSSADLVASDDSLDHLINENYTAVIVRNAVPTEVLEKASERLTSESTQRLLSSPNKGMPGGELHTLGAAATPTYTALSGPSTEVYTASAQQAHDWQSMIFDDYDMIHQVTHLMSRLHHGYPAYPAPLKSNPTMTWLPFNYRVLSDQVQIYAHHDRHYRLPIYEELAENYSRETLFSWFITVQKPSLGGQLTIYGLQSDDPDPPMLPTRFVDTDALEREYYKQTLDLEQGDLVIFNSGQYVHRVTPVQGEKSRITIGGFLTFDFQRNHTIFWS